MWTATLLGFLLLLVAAAVGVGAQSLVRPTAVLCALFAVASLTWYSPMRVSRVALAMLFITPFLTVIPQLRPGQLNYAAFYAVAVAPAALVICARAPRLTYDSGALLLTVTLLSAGVTLYAGGALGSGYGYLVWPITTLSLYLLLMNSEQNLHLGLLRLILSFSVVEALLGISQSLLHAPVFSIATSGVFETDRGLLGYLLPGFSTRVVNGSGTFAHFNGLGALLALSVPIAFGWVLQNPRQFRRVLLFIVLGVGLVTTYSRGGWVGGAVGCLLAYWASRPKSSRSWAPLLAVAGFVTAAILAPVLAAYYGATQDVTTRLETWRYALAYWLRHPSEMPFGSGYGFLQQTLLRHGALQGSSRLSALHSSILQILLELGIVGLVLSIWFLVTTLRPHIVVRRPTWQAWAWAGLLGFLVSQVFDNALFSMTGTCAFALAACLRRPDALDAPD